MKIYCIATITTTNDKKFFLDLNIQEQIFQNEPNKADTLNFMIFFLLLLLKKKLFQLFFHLG